MLMSLQVKRVKYKILDTIRLEVTAASPAIES